MWPWTCVPSFQMAYSRSPKAHLLEVASSAWIIKLFLYSIFQVPFGEEVTKTILLGYARPAEMGVDGWECEGGYHLSSPNPQVLKILALQAHNWSSALRCLLL